MKASPLDKVGNKRGYRAVPVKLDTGVLEPDENGTEVVQLSVKNGSITCDRNGESHPQVLDGMEFPYRKADNMGRFVTIDNYECTMRVHGVPGVVRKRRRHIILHIDGRPQFKKIETFINGKMC